MVKTSKLSLFALGALVLLIAGYFPAALLWGIGQPRDAMPQTGVYGGKVDGSFFHVGESAYSFHFRGETKLRWYWRYPTNFAYANLQLEWFGDSQGSNTLNLPSFNYHSQDTTGTLTRTLFAEWLLGNTNSIGDAEDIRRVNSLFDYIEAAGRGTLPAPRHHGYHQDQPARISIYHFCVGFGVGWTVYFWFGVWSSLVYYAQRRFWRRVSRNPENSSALTTQ